MVVLASRAIQLASHGEAGLLPLPLGVTDRNCRGGHTGLSGRPSPVAHPHGPEAHLLDARSSIPAAAGFRGLPGGDQPDSGTRICPAAKLPRPEHRLDRRIERQRHSPHVGVLRSLGVNDQLLCALLRSESPGESDL